MTVEGGNGVQGIAYSASFGNGTRATLSENDLP